MIFEKFTTGAGAADNNYSPTFELFLNLEEAFYGAEKQVKLPRDGPNLTVVVPPGFKEGTKIPFDARGTQLPNNTFAACFVILKSKPHPLFTRHGSDLHCIHRITLKEALVVSKVEVPLLDGRSWTLEFGMPIAHGRSYIIENLGLPELENPDERGSLVVRFDVVFPDSLSSASKDLIENAFHR